MNIPPEVLNAHQLFLRDDLEEEIGVLDQFRTPLTPEEWAAAVLRAKERGRWVTSYAEHCLMRAKTSFPNLFAIYASIPSGEAKPLKATFRDRYKPYQVDLDGLFYDATLRVNAAMGLPIDGPCPIVAARADGTQLSLAVRPSHFLLHNRFKHTFHVIPWVYFHEAVSPAASAV
jgi:hypothetical protein